MSVNRTTSAADVIALQSPDSADVNMGGMEGYISNFLSYIKDFFKDHGFEINISSKDVLESAKDYVTDAVTDAFKDVKHIASAFKAAAADHKIDSQDLKNIMKAINEDDKPAVTAEAAVSSVTPGQG